MTKPKKILNDPKTAVEEFIEGLLLQYPNHLKKLENHNVVFSAEQLNSKSNRVHLICGGGSGHEPSHAGWLGTGMLSVAVCGGIFASPAVAAVLSAIRAIAAASCSSSSTTTTCPGVLLIVKNYTGDRLNFGMAAERAATEGIPCATVIVADDCALPRTKGITGARGVAGTVLVHKIAGAAAQAGGSLDEVTRLAQRVASNMGTLGIALDAVTVPGAESINDRLNAETIEIGMGVHGEAGMRQSPLLTANDMAQVMIDTIQAHGRVVAQDAATATAGEGTIVPMFQAGDEVVVLVNNLGGSSNFEMSILARACVHLLESDKYGVRCRRVYVASFMTSFDMHGASLTILNVQGQSDLLQWLDAPTTALAWKNADVWKSEDSVRPSLQFIPEPKIDVAVTALPQPALAIDNFETLAKGMLIKAATELSAAEPVLTKFDLIVGDGDCGITMKRGADCILERVANGTIPTSHPVPLFVGLADAVSASMGGTSGVLLELMFRKISSTLATTTAKGGDDKIDVATIARSIQAGVDAVSLYGGAKVGSRTMLDALVPAAAALVETSGNVAAAAAQARQGAESTAAMKQASAGRSNYLSEESLAGTPDPGATAVAIVFQALTK